MAYNGIVDGLEGEFSSITIPHRTTLEGIINQTIWGVVFAKQSANRLLLALRVQLVNECPADPTAEQ